MIRLTRNQALEASEALDDYKHAVMQLEFLPAGCLTDMRLGFMTPPFPMREAVIRMPTELVRKELEVTRDRALARMLALGIGMKDDEEFQQASRLLAVAGLPGSGPRDDGTVEPQKVHEFGAYVSLRQLRLAATLARENGETGQLHCSVPREIGPRLPELVTGFVPAHKYGTRVPMKDEAGCVEIWRILLRD